MINPPNVDESLSKSELDATKKNAANPAVARYRDKTRTKGSGYQFTSFNTSDPEISKLKALHKGSENRVRVRPRAAGPGVKRNQNSDAKMKDGNRFDVYVHKKDAFVRDKEGNPIQHKPKNKNWNESTEVQLSELSKELLGRYYRKAAGESGESKRQANKIEKKLYSTKDREKRAKLTKKYNKHMDAADKRDDGANVAYHRLKGDV